MEEFGWDVYCMALGLVQGEEVQMNLVVENEKLKKRVKKLEKK